VGGWIAAAGLAIVSCTHATNHAQESELKALRAAWVVAENHRAGTGNWHLDDPSREGQIQGYASQTSVAGGGSVTLFVSTADAAFRVEAYRMGYYGGTGGRLVWMSPQIAGKQQAAPSVAAGTRKVAADWIPSLNISITDAWPPGEYLLKLVSATKAQSWITLVVRDDASRSAFVLQSGVTTWEAYNSWGGASLYSNGAGEASGRSQVVTFDRPSDLGGGSGYFLTQELPLIFTVESLGLDVTYWSDIDLHEHPERLLQHRALLTLGHDEYWSTSMRDGAEAALAHGTNLVFFGANAVYRHIRLQPSPVGADREIVNYRVATLDPLYGVNNADVTVDWRAPPLNRPESSLLGEEFECSSVHADMVVADSTSWLLAGTGLGAGGILPQLVGYEFDRYRTTNPHPPNVEIIMHSPVNCQGSTYADMTYYTATSGAGVVDTGTTDWIKWLPTPCRSPSPATDCPVNRDVLTITRNLLAAFGQGPVGARYPSRLNLP
jgi:hypothetical protein